MLRMFIIWHDNDYDFALWVYKNTILKTKQNVVLRQIPKTNDQSLLTSDFTDRLDYFILPYIKFATPDLLIQKIDDGKSKVLVASEFMTHTPQHDHVMQRFERIFCISREKVPVACVMPERKVKLERGKAASYRAVAYKPNPLVIHAYLKTTQINSNPTLVFFWPHKNGYLKFDGDHQTAPKVEDQVKNWIRFIDECIENDGTIDLATSAVVRDQIDFLEDNYPFREGKFSAVTFDVFIQEFKNAYKSLVRASIANTAVLIKKLGLDRKQLPSLFEQRENTVVFEYKSQKLRTDPYAGFLCGVFNLFCMNDAGEKIHNLVHIPHGISFSLVSASKRGNPIFQELAEDFMTCPIHSQANADRFGLDSLIKHAQEKCTYTLSKQQRIFGTLPDVAVFRDRIWYNKNNGY